MCVRRTENVRKAGAEVVGFSVEGHCTVSVGDDFQFKIGVGMQGDVTLGKWMIGENAVEVV